jgi:hypothetical protein
MEFLIYSELSGQLEESYWRMDSNRIPNNLLNYGPHGKRNLGRPLKKMEWNRNRPLGLILDEEEEAVEAYGGVHV